MSQHDYNIANQGFSSFRSDLNNALSAIQTTNSGTSRPTGAVAGQIWLDTTSATSPTLKFYDGADDISFATIDYTANTVNWLDSNVSVTGLTTTATGTVMTLTDSAHTTTVNMILGNNTALRFNELTANGSNYIGLKAPASLSADLTFTLPSTDGTSGQFLKTDGSGNLSFATAGLTGATSTATGTVLTLSDTQNVASVNVILDNEKALRFREATANGTNFVGLKAPTTLASDLTLTLPSADGTSGQVLQTNGSGVLSFNSPSSDYVLLATSTISSNVSSVSIDGYFSSTYTSYKIIFYGVFGSAASSLNLRFNRSGSAITSANYNFSGTYSYMDSSSGTATNPIGNFNATSSGSLGSYWSSVDRSLSGFVEINNPLSTSAYKMALAFASSYFYTNQDTVTTTLGIILKDSTSALSGVTFLAGSGTLNGGTFKIYGIK